MKDLRPVAMTRPTGSLASDSRTQYGSYLQESSLESASQQSVNSHTATGAEFPTGMQPLPDFRLTDRQYQDQTVAAWKQAIGDSNLEGKRNPDVGSSRSKNPGVQRSHKKVVAV